MARKVVISTSRLNSYGFRVLTDGIDISQYEKNPILLYSHFRPWKGTDDEIRPIGTVTNLAIEGDSLVGELNFSQTYNYAKEIEKQWDEGIYSMVSAGFTPVEFSDDPLYLLPGQSRYTLIKCKLDEVSVVDIGANPDALAIKNLSTGKMALLKDGDTLDFIPLINTPNKMIKLLSMLGLPDGATEDQAAAALQLVMNRNKELGDENIALRKEKEDAIKLSITQAVEDAIKLRKIPAEKKESYITLGVTSGLETLRDIFADMKELKVVRPTDLGLRADGSNSAPRDWNTMSDQDRLSLRSDDPDAYRESYTKYYGFAPDLSK